AVGGVLRAVRRPPAALLALVALALLAGGALMAWPRPASAATPPPGSPPKAGAFLSAPPPGPSEHATPAPASPAPGSPAPPSAAAERPGTRSPAAPAPAPASPGPSPAARPFGLPLSVVRDGGLAAILALTAVRVHSAAGPFEWPYVRGGDQSPHPIMAQQMRAHGQYPSFLISPPGFSALTAVICRFAGLTPLALFPVLAPMLLVVTALGAYALATRLWGW